MGLTMVTRVNQIVVKNLSKNSLRKDYVYTNVGRVALYILNGVN